MSINSNEKIVITKAIINGEIVVIDLASESRTAYSDWKRPMRYLGMGKYHSYNGSPAKDPKERHFWKFI